VDVLEIGLVDAHLDHTIAGAIIMDISLLAASYLIWKQYKDMLGYFRTWKYRIQFLTSTSQF
jgi:hypothetical protein